MPSAKNKDEDGGVPIAVAVVFLVEELSEAEVVFSDPNVRTFSSPLKLEEDSFRSEPIMFGFPECSKLMLVI